MQKTQLLVAVIVLLALVFSSTEAVRPCRFCDQQACRSGCKDDLDDCYQYQKDHKKKQHCLTLYYACNAGCAIAPRALGVESPANEEVPSVSSTNIEPPANETAMPTPSTPV